MKNNTLIVIMLIIIGIVVLFLPFDKLLSKNSNSNIGAHNPEISDTMPTNTISPTQGDNKTTPEPTISTSRQPNTPKPTPNKSDSPIIPTASFNHRHEYGDPYVSCTISERTVGNTKHNFRCTYCNESLSQSNNIIGVCVYGFTLDQHLVLDSDF